MNRHTRTFDAAAAVAAVGRRAHKHFVHRLTAAAAVEECARSLVRLVGRADTNLRLRGGGFFRIYCSACLTPIQLRSAQRREGERTPLLVGRSEEQMNMQCRPVLSSFRAILGT